MTDFLLELRSEEIPARMQERAREDLARLFAAEIGKAGLVAESVTTYATPRRLALISRGLPLQTAAVSVEHKGPRTSAPAQALEGFLRKTGLTQDQLIERDGVRFAVVDTPGRATAEVLAEAIPAIIRAFPWPKSMRWGGASATTESLRWVRPLQGIVAILGEELVPCAVDGIAAGYATMGHRFHHGGAITIGGAHDYVEKLRACHVIVDQAERAAIIRETCIALCHTHRLEWIADDGLVTENAGLTEWPVPLLGDFDPAFLELPPEVIRLTLATNQKYFVCRKPLPSKGGVGVGAIDHHPTNLDLPTPGPSLGREGGMLAPAFICTANIEASDGGAAIIAGNRKVLAARLSDARFFWEQDRKATLAEHAAKLDRVVFHEKLGTVADKVERVAKLARWLVEEGIVKPSPLQGRGLGERTERSAASVTSDPAALHLSPAVDRATGLAPPPEGEGPSVAELANLAEQAARLCKADLVTEMVGEFPELQGIMGGYYARSQGLPDAVADAIRDHYKPVGQGDDVPSAPVTVAVSLADKLDTVFAFFAIGRAPTGSKDPFALRRAALGIVAMLYESALRLSLRRSYTANYVDWLTALAREWANGKTVPLPEFEVELSNPGISAPRIQETLHFLVDQNLADAFWQVAAKRSPTASTNVIEFLADRLKVQQRDAGVRHDLIDAVFALGGEDDLVRLLARVRALQAFVETTDGTDLLTAYKRAANILKKETGRAPAQVGAVADGAPASPPPGEIPLSYTPLPEEDALSRALDAAEPGATAAVEREDFEEAMRALSSLRSPIDAFFDKVTVNDADAAKRGARLALLARFRAAVDRIADFSKIEG